MTEPTIETRIAFDPMQDLKDRAARLGMMVVPARPDKVPTWTDPAPPDADCPYDHVYGAAGPVKFRIEWKSWKKYNSYSLDVEVTAPLLGSFESLEHAKDAAQKFLETL